MMIYICLLLIADAYCALFVVPLHMPEPSWRLKPDESHEASDVITPMYQSALAQPNVTPIILTSFGDTLGKAGLLRQHTVK